MGEVKPFISRLFHGTTPTALESIMVEGIRPGAYDNLVYTSVSRQEALMFTYFGKGREITLDEYGEIINVKVHDKLYVIEIDATKLNRKLFGIGHDHNPTMFREMVITYPKVITPDTFVDIWEFDMALVNAK